MECNLVTSLFHMICICSVYRIEYNGLYGLTKRQGDLIFYLYVEHSSYVFIYINLHVYVQQILQS